jgi:hypothetical protein
MICASREARVALFISISAALHGLNLHETFVTARPSDSWAGLTMQNFVRQSGLVIVGTLHHAPEQKCGGEENDPKITVLRTAAGSSRSETDHPSRRTRNLSISSSRIRCLCSSVSALIDFRRNRKQAAGQDRHLLLYTSSYDREPRCAKDRFCSAKCFRQPSESRRISISRRNASPGGRRVEYLAPSVMPESLP